MAFQKIEQDISALPTPPTTAEPESFDAKADAFLTAEATFSIQLKTLIDEINVFSDSGNATADSMNISEVNAADSANKASEYANIAKGVANYQGDYDSSITYDIGESITLNDNIYVSKVSNNTTSPTEYVSTDNWFFNGRRDFVYKTISADTTAINHDGLDIDTSTGAVTVTLPATPLENDVIQFLDLKGTFDTNSLTVARNGNTIMGLAEDLVVDTKNISFGLRFTNNDWRIV